MLPIDIRASLIDCMETLDHNPLDIFEKLRKTLGDGMYYYNADERFCMLEIYQYALEQSFMPDPSEKKEMDWAKSHASYFSNNIVSTTWMFDDYNTTWHNHFKSGHFCVKDLEKLIDFILDSVASASNEELFKMVEFALRNIEVTLRDDLEFNDINRFKKVVRSVLDDIFAEKCR